MAATDADTIAVLEATLAATGDAILVLDLDRRIVRCNPRCLELLRLTADELDARGAEEILARLYDQLAGDGPPLINAAELSPDPSAEGENILTFNDGRVYQRVVAPYRVGSVIAGRVVIYRDVSRWARTDQALTQHHASLEKAQEVARIGSWMAEIDGSKRLVWSTETCRIFGVPPAAFAGTSEAFFALVHPDDVDAVRRAVDAAIFYGRPYDIEHRIVRADGELRWVQEKADIVRSDSGAAVRMVGTVQDITDRRQLEEQLRQSQKLEAIGRLAGGIAHDLNNALTAIVGYTELALGTLDAGHPARPDVNEIRRAAERAESVTRQLLAFSRKEMLEPRIFHLGEVVARLGRLLERLLGGPIELKTTTPDHLPPIYGDPRQIEQAIINLAVNARDAMPDGGQLTIALSFVEVDPAAAPTPQPMPAGEYVELAVTDTGHGMTADAQAHLFEPFFTTKDVDKGTGLGLAMVYGTVKQSGGFIFVESEVGRGTTFRLQFPAAREQGAGTVSAQTTSRGSVPSEMTILVVEDEPAVRNLVVSALGRQGYRVLQASSGEEALACASEMETIDLLLTDASMPGMSGVELASRLVRQRSGLPVIVMSGYTAEALSISGHAVVLLPKPFTPRDLRQKVAEVLAHHRLNQ